MNRDEIEAVMAHEISHISNGDMITMTLIQGIINTTLLEMGFNPRPISGVAAVESNGCKIYIVYGTSYTTDIVQYLSAIRLTAYDEKHDRIGYSQGSVPNNIALGKFTAGEKITSDLVKRLFAL